METQLSSSVKRESRRLMDWGVPRTSEVVYVDAYQAQRADEVINRCDWPTIARNKLVNDLVSGGFEVELNGPRSSNNISKRLLRNQNRRQWASFFESALDAVLSIGLVPFEFSALPMDDDDDDEDEEEASAQQRSEVPQLVWGRLGQDYDIISGEEIVRIPELMQFVVRQRRHPERNTGQLPASFVFYDESAHVFSTQYAPSRVDGNVRSIGMQLYKECELHVTQIATDQMASVANANPPLYVERQSDYQNTGISEQFVMSADNLAWERARALRDSSLLDEAQERIEREQAKVNQHMIQMRHDLYSGRPVVPRNATLTLPPGHKAVRYDRPTLRSDAQSRATVYSNIVASAFGIPQSMLTGTHVGGRLAHAADALTAKQQYVHTLEAWETTFSELLDFVHERYTGSAPRNKHYRFRSIIADRHRQEIEQTQASIMPGRSRQPPKRPAPPREQQDDDDDEQKQRPARKKQKTKKRRRKDEEDDERS